MSAKFWTLLEIIPNLTLIVVLGFGAYAAGHGYVTMGTLVAFITMMLSLVWPIASLGFLLSMTQESFTAANRIAEIFDAPREITDGPAGPGTARRPPRARRRRLPVPGQRATWALRHVTVTVEPGETLALVGVHRVGQVGARRRCCPGSTTSPRARSASTARTSASCPLDALRQAVATAFEDPTLFSMSVAENLRLGRPDATDDQLRQAVEVAAAQFVYDLPFGLDTRIGEQGMSLSGGQRQRLSLARAILADTEDPGARRHPVRAGRAHRGRRRGGAAAGCCTTSPASSSLTGRRRCCSPTRSRCLQTAAPSPTSAPTPSCWPRCREYRYLLAADDELDDGAERACAWEDDEPLARIDTSDARRATRRRRAATAGNVHRSRGR